MTLDQQRAAHALSRVQGVIANANSETWRDEYRSYVRSYPMLLRNAGLGLFIATELAKAGPESRTDPKAKAHGRALEDVLHWLNGGAQGWQTTPYRVNGSTVSSLATGTLERIAAQPEADMLRAHAEVMAHVKWLKLFVEAYIPPRTDTARSNTP